MRIDPTAVVRLQGTVHRLAKKTKDGSTKQKTGNRLANQVIPVAEKYKEASRRATTPGTVGSGVPLLEEPFRRNQESRFSAPSEQGLFYGSRSREGCLIEKAYRELAVYNSPGYSTSGKTTIKNGVLFQVEIDSENCLQLQRQGNSALQKRLRNPADYSFTHAVGAQMRAAGIACFEYSSARSARPMPHFAAFTPDVFCSPSFNEVDVTIKVGQDGVEIRCHDDNKVWQFTRQQFEVNGQLPIPPVYCMEAPGQWRRTT